MTKIERRVYLTSWYTFGLSALAWITFLLVIIKLRKNGIDPSPFSLGMSISSLCMSVSLLLESLMMAIATRFAVLTERQTTEGKTITEWRYCLEVTRDGIPIGMLIAACHPIQLPEAIETYMKIQKDMCGTDSNYRIRRRRLHSK